MKTVTTITCTIFICAVLFLGYLGYQHVINKINNIDLSRIEMDITTLKTIKKLMEEVETIKIRLEKSGYDA
jgi:hypothetical protein